MTRFLLAAVFSLAASTLFAQQPDTVLYRLDTIPTVGVPDSSVVIPERPKGRRDGFFSKNYPDPGKAGILSLVLPGAGQIYNRKWWKLPIVYGVLGGLTFWEIDNVRTYREYRDNYKWIVDGDATTEPIPKYAGVDKDNLRAARDDFRKYVEQTGLALGLAYLLTAADAFVDAHLQRFDVSDDLSLQLRPRVRSGPDAGPVLGLALELQLGRSRPAPRRAAILSVP